MFQYHSPNSGSTNSVAHLTLDDTTTPKLPPPASAPSQPHRRSRTTIDVPQLFSRTPSASPTRSSTFLPFVGSSSRSPSPKRISPGDAAEFDLGSSNEPTPEPSAKALKTPSKVERLASWFEGASEPVNIGLVASPKNEVLEPFYEADRAASTDTMDSFTSRPQTRRVTVSASANTSRFSFFKKTSNSQIRPNTDDLVTLDIRETLLPDGLPEEYTSAVYKDLQLNAESLLRRFQTAYQENLVALRKVTSEKNIQTDELEASTTRNEHLKLQLVEMAERAAEQEKIITALRAENEQQRAQQSIRLVEEPQTPSECSRNNSRHHRPRHSGYAASMDSCVSDDSDAGTTAASVFSDTAESIRSPGTSIGCPSPTLKHVSRMTSPNIVVLPENASLLPSPIMTERQTQVMVPECQKCYGLKPNEAWEVLGIMKMESAALKGRITELEIANDGALGLLAGLNLQI